MVQHLNQIPLDNYKPLREVVVENIRNAIVSGQFPPGMRLMELHLAKDMGGQPDSRAGSHPQNGTGRSGSDDSPPGRLRGQYFH